MMIISHILLTLNSFSIMVGICAFKLLILGIF